jgi:hypothetical protein
MRQVGPGMITQMQRKCSRCGGKGKTIRPGAFGSNFFLTMVVKSCKITDLFYLRRRTTDLAECAS